MKCPTQCRLELYRDAEISERLEILAAKPGGLKSAILSDALQDWLTGQGMHELHDWFGQRLERMSVQSGRIERDQQVALESQPLFIRHFLTVNAPLPQADQAVGRDRFKAFIDQVGRDPVSGTRTLSHAEPTTNRDVGTP